VNSAQVISQLTVCELVTVDDVRKLIMSSPNKAYDLDPVPITVLKA